MVNMEAWRISTGCMVSTPTRERTIQGRGVTIQSVRVVKRKNFLLIINNDQRPGPVSSIHNNLYTNIPDLILGDYQLPLFSPNPVGNRKEWRYYTVT